MEKIIIDTDAGGDIDDVIAIAFAALRPELDLLGVTTVSYDTRRRAALVRDVLKAANRSDVPVAAGMQFPFRPLHGADHEHTVSELRMNHCPPPQATGPDDDDAVAMMARLIEAHPHQITLVGIGLATNLATLLCRYPDLAGKIKAIALMAGEVALLRGEHNVVYDDVAMAQLFHWKLPMFMGTLSVTRQVVLEQEDMKTLERRGSALTDLLTDCHNRWFPLQTTKPGPVMYDLAPILWCFKPQLMTTQAMAIEVELSGTRTRGWTIPVKGQPHIQVTESMNAPQAKAMLMETLLA